MTPDMLMTQIASLDVTDWSFLIMLSLPPLFVIWSKRVHGSRKVFWFVLTSLFSWLAYVAFIIATRDKEDSSLSPD